MAKPKIKEKIKEEQKLLQEKMTARKNLELAEKLKEFNLLSKEGKISTLYTYWMSNHKDAAALLNINAQLMQEIKKLIDNE